MAISPTPAITASAAQTKDYAVCFAQIRAFRLAENGNAQGPSSHVEDGKMTTNPNDDEQDKHRSESTSDYPLPADVSRAAPSSPVRIRSPLSRVVR